MPNATMSVRSPPAKSRTSGLIGSQSAWWKIFQERRSGCDCLNPCKVAHAGLHRPSPRRARLKQGCVRNAVGTPKPHQPLVGVELHQDEVVCRRRRSHREDQPALVRLVQRDDLDACDLSWDTLLEPKPHRPSRAFSHHPATMTKPKRHVSNGQGGQPCVIFASECSCFD